MAAHAPAPEALASLPDSHRAGRLPVSESLPRALTIVVTATAVLTPLLLILYQSLLNAPFFDKSATVGIDAYRFVFSDPDFWQAFKNSFLIAAGMTQIAVPLG